MQFKKWFFENEENAEPVELDRAAQDYLSKYLAEFKGGSVRRNLNRARVAGSNNVIMTGKEYKNLIENLHDVFEATGRRDELEEMLYQATEQFRIDVQNDKNQYVLNIPPEYFLNTRLPPRVLPKKPRPSLYDADLDVDLDPKKLKHPEFEQGRLAQLPAAIETLINDFIPAYAAPGRPAYSIPDNLKLSPTVYRLPGTVVRDMVEQMRNRILDIRDRKNISKVENEMEERYKNNFEMAVDRFLSNRTNANKQYRVSTLSKFSQPDLSFESVKRAFIGKKIY
jgi:hypothetical protein